MYTGALPVSESGRQRSVIFSNRAAAYVQLGSLYPSLDDATAAIQEVRARQAHICSVLIVNSLLLACSLAVYNDFS